MKSGDVSPETPILRLQVKSRTKYRYPQRVLAERTIQEYRLRPGFAALGFSSAALAFLAANGTFITEQRTNTKMWTLNAVGALLASSVFLNMEAVGEPKPTGEERYLRKSGEITQVDTTEISGSVNRQAHINIQFGDITIFEDSTGISGNMLEIPLANQLSELNFTGPNPGVVQINVSFRDSLYNYEFPVSQILQPYAQVTRQLTSLRNSPQVSSNNIVADLAEGSQLPIQSTDNQDWYRVLYGISEHFVLKENAEMVWRTSDFAQKNEIVTVPRIPFGNVDVESNIPILRSLKKNSMALIITNQEYSGKYGKRNYAHRDGRLIKTYLQSALGYPYDNIFELQDIVDDGSLDSVLAKMHSVSNDSTELTVYLSGYGSIQKDENNELNLLGVSTGNDSSYSEISLRALYEELSRMSDGRTLILNDIDFSRSVNSGYSANEAQLIVEENVDNLTEGNNKAAVLFSTHLNQPTSLYRSAKNDDKKHHIFPYYFAKALQQRRTRLAEIYQYLERNVSYTARKLHDRPQDPLLIGNTLLDLQSE